MSHCKVQGKSKAIVNKLKLHDVHDVITVSFFVLKTRLSKPNRDLHRLSDILVASQCRKYAGK